MAKKGHNHRVATRTPVPGGVPSKSLAGVMPMQTFDELSRARYALLRSFRRDGVPVDTLIWFGLAGDELFFRTKVGPKTERLARRREVELAACDYRAGCARVRRRWPVALGPCRALSRARQPRAAPALWLAVQHHAADQSSGRDQRSSESMRAWQTPARA